MESSAPPPPPPRLDLGSFVSFLSSSRGRECLCRLLQFTSVLRRPPSPSRTDKAPEAELYAVMRMTRKILRFGRSLDVLNAIREPQRFRLHRASELLFCVSDHLLWALESGLMRMSSRLHEFMHRFSMLMWLVNVMSSLASLLPSWLSMRARRTSIKMSARFTGDVHSAFLDAEQTLLRRILRNLLDLPLCVHFLRQPSTQVMPSRLVAAFGVASSLLGVFEAWPRCD